MRLLKVYRPFEKFLPINFKFSLSSKRKQFSSCNNPYPRLQQREIGAFLPSSGKTPARKTSGGVLAPRCCQSWAGHAVLPCCLPRTNLVNNPQQNGAGTTAVLLFPTNVLMKSAGALVAPHVFAAPLCSWRSGKSVSKWRGGTCSLYGGARHLAACAEHRPGSLSEGPRPARGLGVPSRCSVVCTSVTPGGFSTPATDPCIKHMVVFNYYLICCSVFLKQTWVLFLSGLLLTVWLLVLWI